MTLPCTADEIQPAWLNDTLAKRFPGVEVASVRLLGTEHGTNSNARLAISYAQAAGAPSTVFAKLPPSEPRRRRLVERSGMGVREVLFYRHLAERVPMRVPAPYVADSEGDAFVMLIEDLTVAGAHPCDGLTGLSLPQAERAIDDYAALHHCLSSDERAGVCLDFVLPPMRQPEYGVGMLEHVLATRAEKLAPAFREIAQLYCDHHEAVHALWEDGPHCVVHGDGHLANLFLEGGRVGFFDWGCMSRAPALRDVGYFLCMALEIRDRRSWEERLLQRYLAKRSALGDEVPSFAQAWQQHRLQASYTVIAAAPAALVSSEDTSANGRYAPLFVARAAGAVTDLDAASLLRPLLR